MTNQEYAFVEGFVKRASEYGLSDQQAIELLKSADITSELGGTILNPLNAVAAPFAALRALSTPTRSDEEQLNADSIGQEERLKQVLLPGSAPYNLFKRFGHARAQAIARQKADKLSEKTASDKDYRLYAEDHRNTAKMLGHSDAETEKWYNSAYSKAKNMKTDELAREMRRVYYNKGHDETK